MKRHKFYTLGRSRYSKHAILILPSGLFGEIGGIELHGTSPEHRRSATGLGFLGPTEVVTVDG